MKTLFLMILCCLMTIKSYSQDLPKNVDISKEAKDVKVEFVTDKEKKEILQTIFRNKQFLQACEIIANDNEAINPNNAIIEKKGNQYEATWEITTPEKSNKPKFAKLVYDFDGTNSSVYFDVKNIQIESNPQTPASASKLHWPPSWWPGGGNGGGGGGGLCLNWSPWTQTNNQCKFSFGCVFKRQQAIFITETRQCKTNPNNIQTRVTKLHCGC